MQSVNDEKGHQRRLATKLAEELKSFFGIFLYLFVLFSFYVVCEEVFSRRSHINFASHGFALINAALFAKFILIGDEFKFERRLRNGPLAITIALQSLFFTALLIVFHFLEVAIVDYWREGAPHLRLDVGGGGWFGLACVALLMFIGLIPFFGYRNLARVIGPERLRAIMLHGPDWQQAEVRRDIR